MNEQTIPVVDLSDYRAGGERRARFVDTVGRSLADIGFFAVDNHDVPKELTERAYRCAQAFFHQPAEVKARFYIDGAQGQRGFTPYGREHAKDQPAADLKEFFQVGRVDVGDDHPVHARYGGNIWPTELVPEFEPTMSELYRRLDALGATLLEACALHIGERPETFRDMVTGSDTIVRVLHYPPIPEDADPASVRAAAHEDINLITLLSGATSEGLELLQRDGSWLPIRAGHDQIVVDSGDMLQNLTNGFYKSTTHRVVNPGHSREERYSMPCFVHPRKEVDLTPLPGCVDRTGGERRYDAITAGDYLDRRLREIGLVS